ncbi:MAG: hypothetical protein CSA21_04540 [Deltaproteobacteria bacterium]|nr:MAG: hypothetical protein CSA21_04540 [Deltaproteobacteria bacterium]
MNQAIAQDENLALDKMIVTAEKTKADAQNVAIPMTVLSQIDIEDRGIDQFVDLTGDIPNLHFLGAARMGGGSFNFRGLGMFGMSVVSEKSPVVINFDGIPWEGRFSLLSNFNDVERVEFLRGPQGSLYGKNAMGGVLNVTTIQPDNQFQGKVGLTMAENNSYEATARCQGPLVNDKLFYFVSGSLYQTDGWLIDHTVGGEKNWAHEEKQQMLTKLVYAPTDRFTAALQYSFGNDDGGNGPWVLGRKVVYDVTTGFTDPEFHTSSHDAALKMDYSFDQMTLTSLSTMRMTHTDSLQYFGLPTSAGFDDIDEDIFSQEIRLASNTGPGEWKWLGGLFYSHEHMNRKTTGYNYDMRDIGFGFITYDYPTVIDSDSYALFGQISIPLFSPKFILTLGSRYEYVKRNMKHRYKESDYLTGALYTELGYSQADSWDSLLGKAALSWQCAPNLMMYASVAQGYTPGGFNYLENNPEYAAFDEQKSLDYELGLKTMLWGGRLMFNPNIFYTQYKDQQITEEVASMQYSVVNAGKSHAQGIEIDWRARLSDSLELYGSLGVIQAKYDYYEELGQNYNGNTIVNTPDYTLNVGATYRNKNGLFAAVDFQSLGKTYFSTDNAQAFQRDAFSLMNGKIGWEFASGLEAYVYVINALDKEYFTETVQEYGMYLVGQPRTFGIQVAYRL